MAKKKDTLERIYNIPLRREWLKAPGYKRAKKAVAAIRQFSAKHMKVSEVKLGQNLNRLVWERGIKNPPHHVHVNIKKDNDLAMVELVGHDYYEPTLEERKAEAANPKKAVKVEAKTVTKDTKAEVKADKKEVKAEKTVDAKTKKSPESKVETKTKAPKKEAKVEPKAEIKTEEKPVEKKPEEPKTK